MNQKPMIILTGPTAVGKSALSVELAKKINGAVISADSMQVYRHMDIGSAKIMPEEMQGITHYMIDELEPDEEFHVVRFTTMAKEYLKEIYAAGKIPIIAGGTGFYIQAKEHGAGYLHEMLRKVDLASAEAIHANNVKRVIRALEFYHLSGQKISEHNETERQKQSPYNFAYFVLNDERAKLYERIDKRVDAMIAAGLVNEVQKLKDMGCSREMVSMQGLGYKEILAYLDGEYTLEEAVYIIKRETRHFAKRQLTWFKRERDVIWLDKQTFGYDEAAILTDMISILQEKEIISHE